MQTVCYNTLNEKNKAETQKEIFKMKIFKKVSAIALAALMLAAFAGCGSKKDNVLSVATNAEFKPFEYLDKDGNATGFDIDLIKAVAEKMGYNTVKIDNMEFDGVVAAVEQGTCDVAASGLTINAKRKKSVDFSDPYYSGAAQILIVGKDDTHYTGTTKEELDEQLKNQTIGVCSGFTGQAYAEGDEEWGFKKIEGATVKVYDNISLAIEDMKNGVISAIIMDDSVAKEAADQNADAIKVIDTDLTVEEYGIAVKKGDSEMVKKVNDALKALEDEGKIKELLEKYDIAE